MHWMKKEAWLKRKHQKQNKIQYAPVYTVSQGYCSIQSKMINMYYTTVPERHSAQGRNNSGSAVTMHLTNTTCWYPLLLVKWCLWVHGSWSWWWSHTSRLCYFIRVQLESLELNLCYCQASVNMIHWEKVKRHALLLWTEDTVNYNHMRIRCIFTFVSRFFGSLSNLSIRCITGPSIWNIINIMN